jgi:hypothetical protein
VARREDDLRTLLEQQLRRACRLVVAHVVEHDRAARPLHRSAQHFERRDDVRKLEPLDRMSGAKPLEAVPAWLRAGRDDDGLGARLTNDLRVDAGFEQALDP